MAAKRTKKSHDKVKTITEGPSVPNPPTDSNAAAGHETSFGVLPARDLKKNLGCG